MPANLKPVQRAALPAKTPFVFRLFRWLAWCAMASYFVAAVTVLGLRYVVLPRMDDWREQIALIASRALDAPVAVARIAADWQGLHPRLHFEGLRVSDAAGNPVLTVPQARATLAWRSVLFLSPQLLSLELTGLDITVQRDAAGEVWLAGRKLAANDDENNDANDDATDGNGTADPASNQTLRWLLAQRELVLREATVRWRDMTKNSADDDKDLVLTNTRMRLLNTPLASQFSITTRPPARLAAGLSVQAELRRNLLVADRTNPRAWSGQLYVQLDDATPRAWLDWLPEMTATSITTPQGQFATRAWFDVARGQLTNVVADLAARKLDWHDLGAPRGEQVARLQADTFQLRLAGSPRDVLAGLALDLALEADAVTAPPSTDMTAALTATNLTLTLPGVFDPPALTLHTLVSEAGIEHAEASGWTVSVRRLDFANADAAGRLAGVWQSAGRSRAGTLDMQGQLTRVALKPLHRYLPVAVNPDARAWLASALTGQADGVAVTVRGDLADFPFEPSNNTAPNPGQFRMAGTFRDTQIDYAPAREQTNTRPARKGWPKLSQLHGTFEVERSGLRLRAQGGRLHTGPSATVTLIRANADIPDMNHNATLHLEADSSGAAADYLAMMAHSPLGELLGRHFDQTHGDGNWRVPLALTVPLLASEQTQVQGRIEFAGNGLTLMPEVPRLMQLTGALAFNEYGVAADGLRGQFLGGPVRIVGELAKNTAGLHLNGTVRAEALAAAWPMPAMQRLSGQTDYTARLVWQPTGELDIHVASSLTGLALDLPPPLSKPAHEPLTTLVSWGPGRPSGRDDIPAATPTPGRWLDVRLGERAEALLQIAPDTDASYFARASVTVGRATDASRVARAARPSSALTLNWQAGELDVAAWDAALDEFTLPGQRPSARPLLPPLTRIDVTSPLVRLPFMSLSDATLGIDINPNADTNAPVWYATLSAIEASGDWIWRAPSAQTPGQFTGRFAHLSWGEKTAADPADAGTDTSAGAADGTVVWFPADAELDFPDVDLTAQQLSLYDRELGALTLVGSNVARGQLWRATDITLTNDDATLQGTALWRLAPAPPPSLPPVEAGQPEGQPTPRGLTLEAALTVRDLGRLMARLGFPDRVAGGTGTASASLQWHNLPWQRRDADLSGRVTIALAKGVFLRASSFSARLLELLSLQSLSRLSRLDVRPDAIFRDGFRFDTIDAELGLTGSRLHATDDEHSNEGITVDSPIATLLLAGDTDFRSERWNLQAAVIPKLDASGAAIAAGIAINPLVGVGALVAQWLLKQPLANAMTARYTVTGTWDEPQIKPLDAPGRAADETRVDP